MSDEADTFEKLGDVVAKVVNEAAVRDVSRRTPLRVLPKPTHPDFKDLTGQRFGRFSVGDYAGKIGNHGAFWCTCDCGNVVAVRSYTLLNGDSQSCGCHKKERSREANISHGLSDSDEYKILRGMLNRCYNKRVKAYPIYGGRGISVCDRWRFGENGKSGVECFIEDMGKRPSKKHTVDRYPNPNGNYEPKNVRWATMKEQGFNKTTTTFLELDGKRMTIPEWSEVTGISTQRLYKRIGLGWSDEKILTKKLKGTNK